MVDFGRSNDPRVQAQLDRLALLSVPQGRFGLGTITALMERLGNPHRKLPPVFHVAGTNGKGSVCAFLRAMLEADGKRVHVTTSPHLVRYNERIRIAGELISDTALAGVLEEVLNVSEDLGPSFFEVTIAAAFLAFSREPAEACVVEVGLGGRFDATNVLEPSAVAVSGIAALGLDHERFLLAPEEGTPQNPMARIAFEKAGIAKKNTPLVALDQVPEATSQIIIRAESVGAPLALKGDKWSNKFELAEPENRHIYRDEFGELSLPLPTLHGPHQIRNAGLALAMLRHQEEIEVSEKAMAQGLTYVDWPGRFQQLKEGPLTQGREVWVDGGHNPSAGKAMADFWADDSVHLIIGMLANKNPEAIIEPMRPWCKTVTAVPVPDHEWHPPAAFGKGAKSALDLASAIAQLPEDTLPIFITGSLYLVGDALRLNGQMPE
ncbi:MAG: folylpolyglutamate synthase/dihydrofolate synthase family protein [Erythrobacter sp.]|uniref:bifunctional folylpolyglutamate synthase/dihydrofolate synthase n=1 Tax=Erythrobacter sp. TaxID=1042 RepID=UPI0026278032|nr:folylpolyglutamate synthase/dihydrofolate synthase family protein [Erythrobacter sp.]MDJ0978002.1 folylpolyglutamate synthase/dihydrofolate synthase family protein [Erythrobacter sp.]